MNTDLGQHVLKNPGVAQAIVDKADLKQSDVSVPLYTPRYPLPIVLLWWEGAGGRAEQPTTGVDQAPGKEYWLITFLDCP